MRDETSQVCLLIITAKLQNDTKSTTKYNSSPSDLFPGALIVSLYFVFRGAQGIQ